MLFKQHPVKPIHSGGDNLIISIAGASSQGLGGVGGFSGNQQKLETPSRRLETAAKTTAMPPVSGV